MFKEETIDFDALKKKGMSYTRKIFEVRKVKNYKKGLRILKTETSGYTIFIALFILEK